MYGSISVTHTLESILIPPIQLFSSSKTLFDLMSKNKKTPVRKQKEQQEQIKWKNKFINLYKKLIDYVKQKSIKIIV